MISNGRRSGSPPVPSAARDARSDAKQREWRCTVNGDISAWTCSVCSLNVETLVITGSENDVCVLATALGAIDLGYRAIILTDAVCSGAAETSDASLKLLETRFTAQMDAMSTETFLSSVSG